MIYNQRLFNQIVSFKMADEFSWNLSVRQGLFGHNDNEEYFWLITSYGDMKLTQLWLR